MCTTEFVVGDVVVLASGGPKMTIDTVSENFVRTVWFDDYGKEVHHGEFSKVMLRYAVSDVNNAIVDLSKMSFFPPNGTSTVSSNFLPDAVQIFR